MLDASEARFRLGEGTREEIDKRRHDDDQRHSGEALVQNVSDACAQHGGSRVLRSRHWCSGGAWNAVDDGRLGHPSASLD